jgi:hypothetical protein
MGWQSGSEETKRFCPVKRSIGSLKTLTEETFKPSYSRCLLSHAELVNCTFAGLIAGAEWREKKDHKIFTLSGGNLITWWLWAPFISDLIRWLNNLMSCKNQSERRKLKRAAQSSSSILDSSQNLECSTSRFTSRCGLEKLHNGSITSMQRSRADIAISSSLYTERGNEAKTCRLFRVGEEESRPDCWRYLNLWLGNQLLPRIIC